MLKQQIDLTCREYANIYIKMNKGERNSIITYSTLNSEQRRKIIKWFLEIMETYNLSYDSFSTATLIMDKYFFDHRISIGKIQLYSATCMIIATKFHEMFYPSIKEFEFLCDGLYNFNNFIEAQNIILKAIDYKIPILNPRFLCYAKIAGNPTTEEFLESVDYMCGIIVPQIHSLTFANQDQIAEAIIDIISDTNLSEYDNLASFEEIKDEINNFIENKRMILRKG